MSDYLKAFLLTVFIFLVIFFLYAKLQIVSKKREYRFEKITLFEYKEPKNQKPLLQKIAPKKPKKTHPLKKQKPKKAKKSSKKPIKKRIKRKSKSLF